PGAISTHPELDLVGIAMNDAHLINRDTETFGDELRERGFVPLAMAVRSGQHFEGSDRIDPNLGGLPQTDASPERSDRLARRDAARLDVAGEADAAQLAARTRLAAAGRELGVSGGAERRIEA